MFSLLLLPLLHVLGAAPMVVSMPTCRFQEDLLEQAHSLLRDMGGQFPFQCLERNIVIQDSAFNISGPAPSQCPLVAQRVYYTMHRTQQLFVKHPSGESWSQGKVDHFQSVMYRLSLCMTAQFPEIQSYLNSVETYIQKEDTRQCAWEMLRNKLLSLLSSVLLNHRACLS